MVRGGVAVNVLEARESGLLCGGDAGGVIQAALAGVAAPSAVAGE